MSWQLKICEPSGEIRIAALKGPVTLGRSENSEIALKDPMIAQEAATIWPSDSQRESPFWIRMHPSSSEGRLGGVAIREAHFPPGIPFQIGDTQFTIEAIQDQLPLPTPPSGVRPWLTCTDAGRK